MPCPVTGGLGLAMLTYLHHSRSVVPNESTSVEGRAILCSTLLASRGLARVQTSIGLGDTEQTCLAKAVNRPGHTSRPIVLRLQKITKDVAKKS